MDYGYGDGAPSVDYGYGDTTDYGYGDSAPASTTDYGYGDAAPAVDYGYGDNNGPSTTDYGYGDDAPAQPKPKPATRRGGARRRGSVTKYSLEEAGKNAGTPEAEMVQQLHAAEMMQQFRNAGRQTPGKTTSEYSTDSSKVSA